MLSKSTYVNAGAMVHIPNF